MDKETFYGTDTPSTISYLEFGAIDLENSRKEVWDFRLHQQAYDWLMLGRYANDLVAYARLLEQLPGGSLEDLAGYYEKEIHHPDDASLNLSKLCALASSGNTPPSFFELGQTVFGCIEGMDFVQALVQKMGVDVPPVAIQDARWYGVDISEYFNDLAKRLHQSHHVTTTADVSTLPDDVDVFFAKGVTLLYSVRTAEDLLGLLNRSRCAIFDYSFATKGAETTTIGTGKSVTYIDLQEFRSACEGCGRSMYVRKATSSYSEKTGRIFADCVYGEDADCVAFMDLDVKVRRGMLEQSKNEPALKRLFHDQLWGNNEWLNLDDFVAQLGLGG